MYRISHIKLEIFYLIVVKVADNHLKLYNNKTRDKMKERRALINIVSAKFTTCCIYKMILIDNYDKIN